MIPTSTPYVVPALIVGNALLAATYPVMNKINNILGNSTGNKKGKDGIWYNSLNQKIDGKTSVASLLKCLVINGEGKPKIVSDLANKIKNISVPSVEYISKMKNSYSIDKLYTEYIKSGKGFREFCKKEKLSEEMTKKLADYVINNAMNEAKGRNR